MYRFLTILLVTGLFACQQPDSKPTETTTPTAPPRNPLGNSDLDVDALAQTTCDCVKKLIEEREQIAKYREEGNRVAALRLITDNRKTQREAFDCSKPHIERIRYNQNKFPGFENALLEKCPQGGHSLLIMHNIHYKE